MLKALSKKTLTKSCRIIGYCIVLTIRKVARLWTLGDRLNENDAFDKIIEFKPKDQLEIVINNLSDDEVDRMSFCFIFKKGRWIEKEYDTFEIMSHYDELAFGDFDEL